MEIELIKEWIENNKAECLDCVRLQNGKLDNWVNCDVININDFLLFLNPKSKPTWQYSLKKIPEEWYDATDETYESGRHLERFNWRQVEK